MKTFKNLICALAAILALQLNAGDAKLENILKSSNMRIAGSPANLETEKAISEAFQASGLKTGEMRFIAPCFKPGKTEISANGKTYGILPMHPTLFRPGNFTKREFSTSLIDARHGFEEDLKTLEGHKLDGAIALMDMACGKDWQRLLRFGITGFIFIEDPNIQNKDATDKLVQSEVRLPRFFINAADGKELRQAISANAGELQISVKAEPSKWSNQELRNLWAIVPGKSMGEEAVLLTAPMDASGIVPELAQGGQNGTNLLLLMRLFEEFKQNPPERTVIFCAVNAHTQYYLGERILAWSLLVPRTQVERSLDIINNDLRLEEMLLGHYRKLNLNPPTKEDAEFIVSLRGLMDSTTGKNITVKEPIVDLARREVNLLKGELLHLTRKEKEGNADTALAERRRELEDLRHHYVNVLTLFNKVGVKTNLESLDKIPLWDAEGHKVECSHGDGFEVGILRKYVNDIVTSRDAWSKLNRAEIQRTMENNVIREAVGARQVRFVFNLELDWSNPHIAISAGDITGDMRWQHRFGVNAARIAGNLPNNSAFGKMAYLDAMTRQGGMPEKHFFPETSCTAVIFQSSSRMPAFEFRNAFTDYGCKFTPIDRFDALSDANVQCTNAYVSAFMRAILNDEQITRPSELKKASTGWRKARPNWVPSWGTQVKAFRFDDFSASVLPQIPVPGAVVVLQESIDANFPVRSGDVVTGHIHMTDARAVANIQGITAIQLLTNAYLFDDDFVEVHSVIDAGEAETKISSEIDRGVLSKTLALFNCVEYPVYTRENPSMLGVIPITEYSYLLLNGRLNSAPKKFGMTGISSAYSTKSFMLQTGPVAFYLEPNEPLKLLTSERVLALKADYSTPLGVGFTSPEEIGPDFFETAVNDMSKLNADRMSKLSGTSDELASIFRERGDKAIANAMASKADGNWRGYLRDLHFAVGAHLKAYKRMTDVTNDMLKAVVFYLALMLPFCFFAEKLLFKFKKIEHEMFAFCLMFALTFCVFRTIHPAFRVAQAPEAIFIAFVMGGLGAFVIKILHGRFEGEMQMLFRTANAFDAGQAGFSTAGQSAMLIGVNNMKRRRIRTALTTATVVLVTFTMLAFTSISKKLSPTVVTRSSKAPYTGIMYHWPGNSRMDEATLRVFEEILGERAQICTRRWLLPQKIADGEVPYRVFASNGSDANIDAFLGLSQFEDKFIGNIPLIQGSYFSSDFALEAIIPEALAKALGIAKEDVGKSSLTIFGRDYKIVGIVDDLSFLAMKDINQHSIVPIKSQVKQSSGSEDNLEAMVEGAEEDSGVFYTDLSALVILPIMSCKAIGGQPYSISAKLNDGISLWSIVDELLTITNATKFFISSTESFQIGEGGSRTTEPGVYYIGEGYRTSIGGLAFLLIPLFISSTIILNTMLGSVFERKAEIAIYNAVGLNPTHIGMFFLAEAFVYSVIGSVGGYLIGQCTSIFLTRTKLITDINLNFSSLSVVYVILFTVCVVLLSTIYPSIVATRAAVPSGKRKWSLPANDGTVMPVVFPFIYHENLIYGINAYLFEYFARFTEASFGDLIANNTGHRSFKDEEGRETLEVSYDVALAPFDLGVTQELKFTVAYDSRVQAYRLSMLNTRKSGQDSNWTATNMPFLEKMRTYLMHWRNLSPAEHSEYIRKGHEIFK